MKFMLAMAILASLSACIGAGQNSEISQNEAGYIPSMTGIDLMGEERAIPADLKGRYNIVTFAFEREQQEQVNTWIDAVSPILEANESVRYYEIPLIYEMNGLMRGWVNNGMRAGIPDAAARERTITVYTDRDEFLNLMAMDTSTIYTLLIDENGKILWRTDGLADEAKIEKLKSAL